MRRYNPKVIEPKWQKVWDKTKLYEVDTAKSPKNKFYVIPMLPYTSGDIHIGHWYNFGPTDTVARWRRMLGYEVLHTNGFDAFGLPAENAAIARGIPPAKWTADNITAMSEQLKSIGASYDWTKQLSTNDPEYYRWTQWLFLKLYEEGLAYRAKGLVNWCPKDQTVLANEQVVGNNNVCERCGTPVEQKELEQWYFKITKYAERLLKDLDEMDWPARVKHMQTNWIGKSQGAVINFKVQNSNLKIEAFTTRPDTLFGATYMVLAPEHPLVSKLTVARQNSQVASYVKKASRKTELERKEGEKNKTGVFTDSYAINPGNGEKIPIWVADYVLMSYGTGAIMAVPAHDERDYDFAKKFKLPILDVIKKPPKFAGVYEAEGALINSGKYNGISSAEARDKIVADLAKKKQAKEKTEYRLRDWLISRQRYWGPPIPIVYCDKDGIVPVPEKDLPVLLPESVKFKPTGQSPLKDLPSFVNVKCPKCGGSAKRETDTMDTFVDSSWYFLRYPDPEYKDGPFNPETIKNWGPVDHYIGGIEHAILHLLYARFITMFLHDYYKLPFEEPFEKLSNQGIILGPDGHKMSKSRGNVVSPDEQVTSYGADSLRLYLMFMGPYEDGGPYNLSGIAGTRRFLDRLWTLTLEFLEETGHKTQGSGHNSELEVQIKRTIHKTIRKVSADLKVLGFNTAIASMMECVNELYKIKSQRNFALAQDAWKDSFITLAQLLAPFAPHISEELWEELGQSGSVHISKWPAYDELLITEETMTLAVQINGKVRAEIEVPADIGETEAIQLAKTDVKIMELLTGKEVKKAIYVTGRLVSLVVK